MAQYDSDTQPACATFLADAQMAQSGGGLDDDAVVVTSDGEYSGDEDVVIVDALEALKLSLNNGAQPQGEASVTAPAAEAEEPAHRGSSSSDGAETSGVSSPTSPTSPPSPRSPTKASGDPLSPGKGGSSPRHSPCGNMLVYSGRVSPFATAQGPGSPKSVQLGSKSTGSHLHEVSRPNGLRGPVVSSKQEDATDDEPTKEYNGFSFWYVAPNMVDVPDDA